MAKIGVFFNKTEWIYQIIKRFFVFWYIIVILLPVPIPLWFYVAVPIISFLSMFFYKDYTKNPLKEFNFFRVSIVVFSATILMYLSKLIKYRYEVSLPATIFFMLEFIIVSGVCCLLYSKNDKKVEFANTLYCLNMFGKADNLVNNGNSCYDVSICKSPDGKDVKWIGGDRFLHMLIIGPTGSGKTSLILIPLIRQDIANGNAVTVIDPKGDLAELVYAMGVEYGKDVAYFNPIFPDCPYFNPLDGNEDRIVETITTIFKMLMPDSSTYFTEQADNLLRKAIMVIKRIELAYTDPQTGISSRPATLITLSDLIFNTEGRGRKMAQELGSLPAINVDEKKQNADTRDWFLNKYFSEQSKEYEHTSGVRTQVANLIQNSFLRKVFNPPDGKSQINFDEYLEQGKSIAISTAQGELRELSTYLGYFIIFSLEASILRRKGTEETRIPNFLYIDEFQKYANDGFEDILTQGRSFRVSAVLATQARGLIEGGSKDGKRFLNAVDSNCRNIVLFSGISSTDAKYFSDLFGEKIEKKERYSYSHDKTSFFSMGRASNPKETISYDELEKPNFTSSDIIYAGFSEIKYRLICDKNITPPQKGIVSWIDADLNNRLKHIASEYREGQLDQLERIRLDEAEQKKALYATFLAQKGIIKSPVANSQGGEENNNSYLGAKIVKSTLGDSAKQFGNATPEQTESNEAEWSDNTNTEEEERFMFSDSDINGNKLYVDFDS